MKRVISCLVALALMICAVASVSAEISPSASVGHKIIRVDAIPVGGDSVGQTVPSVNNPVRVDVGSGDTVKLTATPTDGYKFSHWEFGTGEFEIVEGDLNSPVIVIRPTGDDNIRAYAHFVKEDEDVTAPSSKPVHKPSDDTEAPKTGDPVATYAVAGTALIIAAAAVVLLKKRQSA
ncbi:MAG: LPXTG cell wall anchor domain-containing protein [Clostridia bacterium]|nr:LPXTG cell wall anchor domain-containing protein [Clostridia bacterium]